MPLTDEQLAESIVLDVIELLKDRKGFDAWWHDIDEEIKEDIRLALNDRTQYWIEEARV